MKEHELTTPEERARIVQAACVEGMMAETAEGVKRLVADVERLEAKDADNKLRWAAAYTFARHPHPDEQNELFELAVQDVLDAISERSKWCCRALVAEGEVESLTKERDEARAEAHDYWLLAKIADDEDDVGPLPWETTDD